MKVKENSMAKKILLSFIVLLFMITGSVLISYSVSKSRAETIAQNYRVPISPLEGRLIIFMDSKLKPCWIFVGEYEGAISGATFDVYMSFFGEVLNAPH